MLANLKEGRLVRMRYDTVLRCYRIIGIKIRMPDGDQIDGPSSGGWSMRWVVDDPVSPHNKPENRTVGHIRSNGFSKAGKLIIFR